MKKQTLAPAVLASLTAAGLVLAPVAAFAQDSDASNASLSDSASHPTATPTQDPAEKQQKQAEEHAAEEPTQAEPTPSEDNSAPAPSQPSEDAGDTDDGASDDEATADPTDEATETEEPTEEPTDDPTEDVDAADVTITPQNVDLTDVVYFSGEEAPSGATITGEELEPNTRYDVTVTGGPEASGELQATTDGDGSFELTYTIEVDSDADLESFAGDRSVAVTDPGGTTVDEGSFEIINDIEDEDEEDQADPALDVPDSITVDDVMVPQGEEPGDRGLQIAATGLAPGERYTLRVIAPDDTPDLSTEFEVDADEDGNAVGTYFIEWYGDYSADVIAGTFAIELVGEDEVLDSAEVEFTVGSENDDPDDGDESDEGEDGGEDSEDGDESEDSDDGRPGEDDGDDSDEAALDPGITVSPGTLPAAHFMNFDRGVQVAASNCLPGDMVSLEVMWPGTDEVAYADGIEADDDGAASFSFYGTGSNAADYVGTWKVSITCGGETVADSFTVTGAPGDNGDSGSELPRTGSDAGILAIAAAGLLTVGAATVMLSSRPKRRDTV